MSLFTNSFCSQRFSFTRWLHSSLAIFQVLLAFAGVLLFSSFKLLTAEDEDEDEDLTDNFIVKFCRCCMDSFILCLMFLSPQVEEWLSCCGHHLTGDGLVATQAARL